MTEMTKQEIEGFKELNDLLSQGEMKDQPKTLEFVGGLVANRCYQDEAFAKAFRADPDGTMRSLASEIGVELSDKLKIVANENDANTWHVPMPSQALLEKMRSSKLSDAQMGHVSGGEIIISLAIGGTIGAGVVMGTTIGMAKTAQKKAQGKK